MTYGCCGSSPGTATRPRHWRPSSHRSPTSSVSPSNRSAAPTGSPKPAEPPSRWPPPSQVSGSGRARLSPRHSSATTLLGSSCCSRRRGNSGFTVPVEAAVHLHLDAEPFRHMRRFLHVVRLSRTGDRRRGPCRERYRRAGGSAPCRRAGRPGRKALGRLGIVTGRRLDDRPHQVLGRQSDEGGREEPGPSHPRGSDPARQH